MNSPVRAKLVKVAAASIAALVILQGCSQEEAAPTDGSGGGGGGTTLPSITIPSGTYYTSCTAIPGMTIGGATHKKMAVSFGVSGVAENFSTMVYYTDNASCALSGKQYGAYQTGTVTIGNATTSPSGGYEITFHVTAATQVLWTAAAKTDFTSGCSTWGPYSGSLPVVRDLYSDISCANVTMKAATTTLYNNIVVVDSTHITMGTPTGQNPGVETPGAVSPSQTFILSQ